MSAVLFDLAVRVAAHDAGVPVPRLLHNPAPMRETRVAVGVRRRGSVVHVQAVGSDGHRYSGYGPEGLAAVARASGCAGGDLGGGATAVVDSAATLRVLGELAARHADPALASAEAAAGSALAGWWAERAAHPGTSAVTDVLGVSRQRFMLGVVPGADHAGRWRAALAVPTGVAGLHVWHRAVTGGDLLAGLEQIREDDDWHLGKVQETLNAGRSWDRVETLHVAAARLASRCDATDLFEAALLGDPLWRARGVHGGFVCRGEVVVGAGPQAGRVTVRADRLDTRLRPGAAVIGWPGEPMAPTPGVGDRFGGDVVATEVVGGALKVTIGGLRKSGYRPVAAERVTVIPAPPSPSTIRSRRAAVARLYRRRFSWLSQGTTPTSARRAVPLAVMIAAADDEALRGEGGNASTA